MIIGQREYRPISIKSDRSSNEIRYKNNGKKHENSATDDIKS